MERDQKTLQIYAASHREITSDWLFPFEFDDDSTQARDSNGKAGFGNGGVSYFDSSGGGDDQFATDLDDRPALSYNESAAIGAHRFRFWETMPFELYPKVRSHVVEKSTCVLKHKGTILFGTVGKPSQ
jgi:hypothetical protein